MSKLNYIASLFFRRYTFGSRRLTASQVWKQTKFLSALLSNISINFYHFKIFKKITNLARFRTLIKICDIESYQKLSTLNRIPCENNSSRQQQPSEAFLFFQGLKLKIQFDSFKMSTSEDLISSEFLDDGANEEVVASSSIATDEEEDEEDVEIEAMDDEDGGGRGGLLGLGNDGVIAQLIDIREPLVNLRRALERRLNVDLSEHDFWLQDSQLLPENTTLVEQCVQGEGLVQINVEIKEEGANVKKINIVDVLKPAEDVASDADDEDVAPPPLLPRSPPKNTRKRKRAQPAASANNEPSSTTSGPGSANQESVTRWVVCGTFRKEQERLNMPTDPVQWNKSVRKMGEFFKKWF